MSKPGGYRCCNRHIVMVQMLMCLITCSVLTSAMLEDYPQRNMVAFFNGDCEEHICEFECKPWNGGYVCGCPDDMILKANGFSCQDISETDVKTRTSLPTTTEKDVLLQQDEVYIEQGLLGKGDSQSDNSDSNKSKQSTEFLRHSSGNSYDSSSMTNGQNISTVESAQLENPTSDDVKVQTYDLREGMPSPAEITKTHQESKKRVHSDNEVALEKVNPKFANVRVELSAKQCQDFSCRNGGFCSVEPFLGTPHCNCLLGTRGKRCGKDVDIRYPKFSGSGYLAFPVLRNAYKEFTITIQFKPVDNDGVLLFSSEREDAAGDFFSIALINGHVNFRFDCGTDMAVFNSIENVTLGEWNIVWAQRVDNHGWLKLNEEMPIGGTAEGNYTRITLREDLYLGGYKEMGKISERVGTSRSFTGCIEELWVNSYKYDMRRAVGQVGDAVHGLNVDECSINVCGEILCENGGQCMARSADKHVCLCPLRTAGTLCQNKVDIHIPAFNGHSYLQFKGLRRTTLTYTEIEVILKPKHQNGLILYNGYTTDRKGDFIALLMRDGHVEFSFDLGTGPAVLRSVEAVSLDEWHVIKVYRTGMDGILEVDDQEKVEALSKGAYTQLTLLLELFIGGHKNFDHLSKHVNITESFNGCIQKVVINEKPLKLIEEAEDGVNVDNCQHPCVGNPCMNGGLCEPSQDLYTCNCPLGYTNTNCEEIVGRQITVPKFERSSYLKFVNPNIIKRVTGKKIDIQMHISVGSDTDGLLFWNSHEPPTSSSDYIALGFNEGLLQLRFNLGCGESVIEHNSSQLLDGNHHIIHAQRDGQDAYLSIDGTEIFEGSSPGKCQYLNTNKELYIGGMPDVAHRTRRRFTTGFTGCISKLILATDYEVNLIGQTESGSNVAQCT